MGMTVTKHPWLNIGEEACNESWHKVLKENKLPSKVNKCLRRPEEDEWETVVSQWLRERHYGEAVRGPVCSHKPVDVMGQYIVITAKYTTQLASGDVHYKVRITADATTMRLYKASLTTSHY